MALAKSQQTAVLAVLATACLSMFRLPGYLTGKGGKQVRSVNGSVDHRYPGAAAFPRPAKSHDDQRERPLQGRSDRYARSS